MSQPYMYRGCPPLARHRGQSFMVFTKQRGWCEARWHRGFDMLEDVDRRIPESWRMIPPDQVEWWMTQHGGPVR